MRVEEEAKLDKSVKKIVVKLVSRLAGNPRAECACGTYVGCKGRNLKVEQLGFIGAVSKP
jgi:hypothetical protein